MDAIAKIAWYACAVRAADALRRQPICHDGFAQSFMLGTHADEVWGRFRRMWGANAAAAARHRLIDDLLCQLLARFPELPVLVLGAGFDTRAYRLPGGCWLEVDQPSLVAYKNHLLPVDQATNPLRRLAIDVEHQPLGQLLAPALSDPAWADHRGTPVVVMEGLSMYIDPTTLGKTLALLRKLMPRHTLVIDLLDLDFDRRYCAALRRAIRKLGVTVAPALPDPEAFVASLGYRQTDAHSIVGRAVAHGLLPIPQWLLDGWLRPLRDGYRVLVFEAVG
jgi:methyltransferase (TIGR00027 family)